MDYRLTMIARTEVFCEHPGVLFFSTRPQIFPGDVIRFKIFDEVIALGKVVAIEEPNSNIRADCGKNGHKFKLHWFPVRSEEADQIQELCQAMDCPDGCTARSMVYITDKDGSRAAAGRGVRYRKCPQCGTRWTTKEIFVKRVTSIRKKKGTDATQNPANC